MFKGAVKYTVKMHAYETSLFLTHWKSAERLLRMHFLMLGTHAPIKAAVDVILSYLYIEVGQ